MSTTDLTEYGLKGICIEAKDITAVYDIQRLHETFPRIYIHIAHTDAILITRQFDSKSSMEEALHRLKKLKEVTKPLHLKSVT